MLMIGLMIIYFIVALAIFVLRLCSMPWSFKHICRSLSWVFFVSEICQEQKAVKKNRP